MELVGGYVDRVYRLPPGGIAGIVASQPAVELVERLRALGQSHGLSPRDVLHPLRIALTGAPRGLPLPVVVAVLPREESLRRCRT